MPIEIRELVIRAVVGNPDSSAANKNSTTAGSKEDMVNEIIEQVLAVIKEKSER